MQIYKDMYYYLFNAVSDVLNELPQKPKEAKILLESAQIKCEEMFVENDSGIDEELGF